MIYGKWTECMYSVDSKVYDSNKKAEKKAGGISKKQKQVGGAVLHSPFKLYSHI